MKSDKLKDKTRRNFIKTIMLGTGATIIGGSLLSFGNTGKFSLSSKEKIASSNQDLEVIPDDPKKHWGFVIDLAKCDGCESQTEIDYSTVFDESKKEDKAVLDIIKNEKPRCQFACRIGHNFLKANPPQYWINVYKLQDNPNTPPYFFPKPCQNCQDPPCEHVCPTGATFIRKDGTVLIDHRICIGCRICMAGCPYETRFFWYNEPNKEENAKSSAKDYQPEHVQHHTRGTVAKCDYCLHQVVKGSLPHCAEACPQGAIYFGNLNEDAVTNGKEILELNKVLEAKGAYRFKEQEGTHPSVYYLPPSYRKNNIW